MSGRMKWGVLGVANIATGKVIPGFGRSSLAEVVAIASRDAAKAERAAADLGIARAHGSYEALLADPDVEAVYNPLPNHLHVPWTLKALAAGKHVLCEKPIALTAAEAEALIEARERSGRGVLEAFMARQHPQWLRVRDLVRGELGTVRLVNATYAYDNRDPANVRNKADIGGGALYDIGCYATMFGRFAFAAEPARAVALIDRDPDMGTDRLTSGLVDFGAGRHLVFTVSTQLQRHQRTDILGDRGRIEVPVSLNAPPDVPTRILLDRTGAIDGSGVEVIVFEVADQYALQADYATRVFRGDTRAEFGIEDAIANMRVIDALYRSARTAAWESV